MKEKFDVVSIGELLIDFTQEGVNEIFEPKFTAHVGGAPGNVLAELTGLGNKTAMISKVGNDQFGRMIIDCLDGIGIDRSYVVVTDEASTTMAFVHKRPNGDRDFTFVRKPGADILLRESDFNFDLIEQSRLVHFGTVSMTSDPSLTTVKETVLRAEKSGKLISFDPNIRLNLWADKEKLLEAIDWGFTHCDILKISDDELEFLIENGRVQSDVSRGGEPGTEMFKQVMEEIQNKYQIPVIFLTLGAEGSLVKTGKSLAFAKGFRNENYVDATGAGDTFMAASLHQILQIGYEEIQGLTGEELERVLKFSNAAASIIVGRKGSLKVMPSLAEIEEVLNRNKEI